MKSPIAKCIEPIRFANPVLAVLSSLTNFPEHDRPGFRGPDRAVVWVADDLVMANLSPEGYREIDRVRMLEATKSLRQRSGGTVRWSHPPFAGTSIFARKDQELVHVDLAE